MNDKRLKKRPWLEHQWKWEAVNAVIRAYLEGQCSLLMPIEEHWMSNSNKRKFGAQMRLKAQNELQALEQRKAVALSMPLPANRIYQEPDREPVDRLAASMFFGEQRKQRRHE